MAALRVSLRFDGTDALLKFPVFEGWGNHDGPPEKFIKQQRLSVQSEIKRRNAARLEKKLISNVSANGLHYSWDWSGIHFVQTNLYPADKQNSKVRYSLPWHDPQNALQFVKDDLAAHVADSGRPVIIMAHCGFDTDWWVADDWTAFYQAVKPYNVIAYFHGHSGTGVKNGFPKERLNHSTSSTRARPRKASSWSRSSRGGCGWATRSRRMPQ